MLTRFLVRTPRRELGPAGRTRMLLPGEKGDAAAAVKGDDGMVVVEGEGDEGGGMVCGSVMVVIVV